MGWGQVLRPATMRISPGTPTAPERRRDPAGEASWTSRPPLRPFEREKEIPIRFFTSFCPDDPAAAHNHNLHAESPSCRQQVLAAFVTAVNLRHPCALRRRT